MAHALRRALDVHADHADPADRHPQQGGWVRPPARGSAGRGAGDRRRERAGRRDIGGVQHRGGESGGPRLLDGVSVLEWPAGDLDGRTSSARRRSPTTRSPALSTAGQLCVWTSTDSDIIVDITGWLGPSGSSAVRSDRSERVVDTRSGIGGLRLPAGSLLSVDLDGYVPAGSTAVALNVTAVNSSTPGYLSAFPCSGSQPETSTVNHVAGEARPNNTIVGLSAGRVCIFSYAETTCSSTCWVRSDQRDRHTCRRHPCG